MMSRRAAPLVGICLCLPAGAGAAAVESVASGAWSAPATWAGGSVPAAGDDVRIAAGHTVRYDLASDAVLASVMINGALLFVVVFYLYPLKFLATMLFNLLTGEAERVIASRADGDALLAIYSAGYAGVFLLLAAFYWHAWRRREALELTAVERLITTRTIAMLLVHVITALITLNLALSIRTTGIAGAVYFLIGPLSYLVGSHFGRRIDALTKTPEPEPSPAAEPA